MLTAAASLSFVVVDHSTTVLSAARTVEVVGESAEGGVLSGGPGSQAIRVEPGESRP